MTNSCELFDKEWIINKANDSLNEKPSHITDAFSKLSEGGIHDFYSNGDYWWPNLDTSDGLPYIRHDGQSNPNAFFDHRLILRKLRSNVANLSAGYLITGNEAYSEKAVIILKEFFIDEDTKMNPNLLFTQAIPGVCSGRGIGIIDTLHLIDIPVAIETLSKSTFLTEKILLGLKQWFSDYLKWMTTHKYGIEEMNEYNNHGVTWNVQAAVFAKFTNNTEIQDLCRERYKKILLPDQMALNGSFPAELKRTKPYSYSIFVLDNMVTICQVLSKPEDDLWKFKLQDGRSIRRGIEFLYPYLEDKTKWPFRHDVEHFKEWPVAIPSLIFAGYGLNVEKYIKLWKKLDKDPKDDEVRRNIAIRQPLLWL